jgi:hypothetical protein
MGDVNFCRQCCRAQDAAFVPDGWRDSPGAQFRLSFVRLWSCRAPHILEVAAVILLVGVLVIAMAYAVAFFVAFWPAV